MFWHCRNLVNAPVMRGNGGNFEEMFAGCTSLVNAPELPDIATLDSPSDKTFKAMFSGCTSLVNGPSVITASEINGWGCNGMFEGCVSMTHAPVIMAGTIAGDGCGGMFNGCASLQYIKCLATWHTDSTGGWVNGVSATGTFVKAASATWTSDEYGNGYPQGWTVVNAS